MRMITSTSDSAEEVGRALESAGMKVESIDTLGADGSKQEKKDLPAAPAAEAQVEAGADKGKTADDKGAPEEKKQETKKADELEGKKPAAGVQKRIDELTRERYERDGRIEQLTKQVEDLKAIPRQETAEKPAVEKPVEPKPKPVSDDFPDYSDFVEALTDWKADQREAKLQGEFDKRTAELRADLDKKASEREARSEAAVQADVWAEHVQAVKADPDYADWDTVAEAAADVMVAASTADAIGDIGPDGPRVLYWLSTHPEEAKKVFEAANYDPAKTNGFEVVQKNRIAGREVGRILGLIETEKASKGKPADKAKPNPTTPAKPKTTAAPEPIEPLRAGASATGLNPYDESQAARMTPAEFREWRKANPKG